MASENDKAMAEKRLEVLKAQLAKQIEGFKQRRRKSQQNATITKALTIGFGFGITILLGLDVSDTLKPILSNIALVLGALITMLASWDAFSNYRALWVRYSYTYTQLLALKAELEFEFPENSGQITEDEVRNYQQRFENILKETNEYWRDLRKEESSKSLT